MEITLLRNQNTDALDELLLDADGFCRPLPAAELREIERDAFRIWCAKKAIYIYPSAELIDYLRALFGHRSVIEVGAGNGHLGHALGIYMTDSGMQTEPSIAAHYAQLGQAITMPPTCVEIIDAEAAIVKHKPQIVVASWLTHRHQPGMSTGNAFGPEEINIIQAVEMYVHIGNDRVHYEKPIWQLPHQKMYYPWLVSRSADETVSHIAIWEANQVQSRS